MWFVLVPLRLGEQEGVMPGSAAIAGQRGREVGERDMAQLDWPGWDRSIYSGGHGLSRDQSCRMPNKRKSGGRKLKPKLHTRVPTDTASRSSQKRHVRSSRQWHHRISTRLRRHVPHLAFNSHLGDTACLDLQAQPGQRPAARGLIA